MGLALSAACAGNCAMHAHVCDAAEDRTTVWRMVEHARRPSNARGEHAREDKAGEETRSPKTRTLARGWKAVLKIRPLIRGHSRDVEMSSRNRTTDHVSDDQEPSSGLRSRSPAGVPSHAGRCTAKSLNPQTLNPKPYTLNLKP